MMVFQIWSVLVGILLCFSAWRAYRFFSIVEYLFEQPTGDDTEEWPLISLVIPACNEISTIGPAARSLFEINYPNLQFILVDDRSTDGTTLVIRDLVAGEPRAKAVEITSLPGGWLGKVHALHRGELAADGDWILFTDADVVYAPDSLRKAMTLCRKRNWDFLCIIPSFLGRTFPLRILLAQLQNNVAVVANMQKLSDPKTGDCMGSGAFALVRREAYRRTEGLPWLRLEVLDDFGLSYLMKVSGARCGFMSGIHEVELEWYPSAPAFIKGIEKNSFTSFQYSLPAATAYMVGVLFIFFGFTLAPLMAGGLPALFVWGVLAIRTVIAAVYLPRMIQVSRFLTLGLPLAFVLAPAIMFRASLKVLRAGGINWRGTFYSLRELRDNQRLKILDVAVLRKHTSPNSNRGLNIIHGESQLPSQ